MQVADELGYLISIQRTIQTNSTRILTVTKLQAKNLLVSQQRQELDHLSTILSAWIVIEWTNAGFDNNTHYYISGRWAVSYRNIINYIFDRWIVIWDIYNKLSIELQAQVTTIVSKLVIEIVDGIANIQAECIAITFHHQITFHLSYHTNLLNFQHVNSPLLSLNISIG